MPTSADLTAVVYGDRRAAPIARALWPSVLGAGLLLSSGVLATVVSYDPARGWRPLLLLGLGLALAVGVAGGWVRPGLVAAGVAGLGVLFALYFLLQNDFAHGSKFALVGVVGRAVQGLVPDLGWHKPHPNIAAGALELALPFGLLGLAARRAWLRVAGAGAGLVCAGALLLTESRGAWVALAAAFAGAGLGYLVWGRRSGRIARRPALLAAAAIGLAVAGAALALLIVTLQHPPLVGSFLKRLLLYSRALALVGDYPWTGAGLGTFEPTFSQYVLFNGSPPEPHAHDLWLDLWIAQGVAGVLGYGLITLATGVAAWRAIRAAAPPPLFWAALVAWLTLLVHGLGDDVHYQSLTLPALVLMPALVLASTRTLPEVTPSAAPRRVGLWVGAGAVVLGGLAVLCGAPLLSLAQSNVGNLYQARADLGGHGDAALRAAADDWLTRAATTWPGNPSLARRAVYLYLGAGQLDRALAYQQASGAAVDAWPWMARTLSYQGAAPALVQAVYAVAADRGTADPLAYYGLARAAADQAAWTEAARRQQDALARDPAAGAEAYALLGDWQFQAGDPTGAQVSYRHALTLAPDNPQAAQGLQQLADSR